MNNIAFSFEEALDKAKKNITETIPSFVIDVVNDLITNKLRESVVRNKLKSTEICFKLTQTEVVNGIIDKVSQISTDELEPHVLFRRTDIFDKGWLDFEFLYRQKGWNVNFVAMLASIEEDNYWEFKYANHN